MEKEKFAISASACRTGDMYSEEQDIDTFLRVQMGKMLQEGPTTAAIDKWNVTNAMNECLKAVEFTREQADEITERSIMHGARLWHTTSQRHETFLKELRTSPHASQCFNDKNTFAQLMAYMYSVVTSNCDDAEDNVIDELLEPLGMFDYKKELIVADKHWYVPLSGRLSDDVRINYVAKVGRKTDREKGITFISCCLETAKKQVVTSAISKEIGRTRLPFLPDSDTMEAWREYAEMFVPSTRCSTISKPAQQSAAHVFADFLQQDMWKDRGIGASLLHSTWPLARSANMFFTPQFFVEGDGIVNTGIKDVEGHRGLDAYAFYYPAFYKTPEVVHERDEDGDITENGQDHIEDIMHFVDKGELSEQYAARLHSAADMLRMIARERTEYEKTKQQILDEKNTNKKTVTVRKKELARLQKSAENEDKLGKELLRISEQFLAAQTKVSEQSEKVLKLENQLQQERMAVKKATEEIARLEQLVAALTKTDPSQKETKPEYDTSILDNLSVVIVGGHKTWVRGIKDLHPNIKIYDADGIMPSEETLICADVVWMQSNCIGHSQSEPILSTLRKYGVPLRYFRYEGHQKCIQQLLEETGTMFGGIADSPRLE